jgi:hypothetical protein
MIINNLAPGSITFRTYFNPVTVGCFVAHCHTLDHEDLGMMQRMDILPAPGQPSGCSLDQASAAPLIEKFIASRSSFQICSAPRQSRSISYRPMPPANWSNRPAVSTRRPASSPAFGGLIHKLTNTLWEANPVLDRLQREPMPARDALG